MSKPQAILTAVAGGSAWLYSIYTPGYSMAVCIALVGGSMMIGVGLVYSFFPRN